jgi:hypothetical protein
MVVLVLIVLYVILQLLSVAGIHVGGPFRWSDIAGRSVAALPFAAAVHLQRLLR